MSPCFASTDPPRAEAAPSRGTGAASPAHRVGGVGLLAAARSRVVRAEGRQYLVVQGLRRLRLVPIEDRQVVAVVLAIEELPVAVDTLDHLIRHGDAAELHRGS